MLATHPFSSLMDKNSKHLRDDSRPNNGSAYTRAQGEREREAPFKEFHHLGLHLDDGSYAISMLMNPFPELNILT